VVIREEVQSKKPAVGRGLIDLPGYVFKVLVTNRGDSALLSPFLIIVCG